MAPEPEPDRPGVEAATATRLYHALIVVVVSLPLMDLEVFQLAGKSVVLPYITVAALAALVVSAPGVLARYVRSDGALPFLAAWLFIAGVSAGWAFLRSQDSGLLAANVMQLANVVYMGAHYVVLMAALQIQTPARLIRLRDVFIATGCVGALLSVYQVASVVYGWPYVEWLRTSNLYFKAHTLNWHGGGSWIALPRAYGSAPEPTFWAGFLALALAFSLARILQHARVRWVLESLLITVGLVLTFSRAAIPPLAAGVFVWLLLRRGRNVGWIVPVTVATTIALTIWPVLLDERRLALLRDHSAIERLSAQVTGLRMVGDHPIVGVGPGSVPALVDRYLFVVEGEPDVGFSRLYSFLLIVIVTTGVIGTLAFSAYLLEVGRRICAAFQAARSAEQRTLAAAGLMGFVMIAVYWVGSPAYNMSFLWFVLAFGSALESVVEVGRLEWPGSE